MKKLFKLLFDQLETVGSENIDNFSGGFWAAHGAADKQGTLTLFFCVVKPLYKQFFDWNQFLDIGSEGKIWKSVQNSFFHWKNEDKSLGNVKYTLFLANSGHL